MKIDGCSALITGASAGIGREFARLLAKRARSLVLVARRRERLEELKAELGKENPDLTVHIRVVDLAETGPLHQLIAWLKQERIEIDLLINNAGLGDMGTFATSEAERLESMLLVNISALTLLSRELLPDMLSHQRGGILNVSSCAGFLPIPEFSVYAATKAYVTSFSEGLRAELRGTGISVCALCPGPVHTEFSQVAQRTTTPPRHPPGAEIVYVSAVEVARVGLGAIENDRPLVIPGLMMKVGMAIVRMMPLGVLRLASGISARRSGTGSA
jgi:short-subunit dehydrogenase